MTDIITIAFFIAWGAASILYTVFNRRIARYTNRWDPFRLLTSYQLFTGPARTYGLFYRDRTAEGVETRWEEITLYCRARWYHAVWFPQGQVYARTLSMVDDLARFVCSGQAIGTRKPLVDRFIYRQIVRVALAQPSPPAKTSERQFKITESAGDIPPVEADVFVSGFHVLENGGPR